MVAYNGKGGSVTFATSALLGSATNSWSVTTISDVADATNMGDTWMSSVAGLTDFNATVEADSSIGADYPALLTAATGELVTFKVVTGGPNLSGDMIVTGISETASIEDIGKVSITLEGNDEDGLILAAT